MPACVENLHVWWEDMQPTRGIYRASSSWPKEAVYGLTVRGLWTGVSLTAALAEGVGRSTAAALSRNLRIAFGNAYGPSARLGLTRDFDCSDHAGIEGLNGRASSLAKQISVFLSHQEGRK